MRLMGEMDAVPAPDDKDVTGVPSSGPGMVLGQRFVLTESLKQRHSSETWLAVDRTDGSTVVVKLVRSRGISSAVRLRLEHEARVLNELDLPSRPITVGLDGGLMYLAQPYVEGRDLAARLTESPLPIESVLRIGVDVFGALAQVHDLGIVHRDVKPANIVVSGAGGIERAALIDFGLARSAWLDPSLREEPVGTARYLAPEVAGLVDAEVDERADLYSAGVVLYECLAGRAPFEGTTVGEVLHAHATVEPAPMRNLRRGIPSALDGLVRRLLAKEPSQRYQSAAAVVADLETLWEGLRSGVSDPPVPIGMTDRRRSLTEAGYIGRDVELAALSELVSEVASRPGLVLVEAESGGGKSRLLDEVCLRLDPGTRLFRGQGADRVARRPFQMLDGVAAAIAQHCRDDESFRTWLVESLVGWTDAVVAAIPALAPVLGVEPTGEGPEAYGEARTINALCALLDAAGGGDRPAVIVLDDAQWADSLTLKLLSEWPQASRRPASAKVLVVAAFRSEEVGPDHPLRGAPARALIQLAPMSGPEVVSLCESMAGPLPEEASEAVAHLSEGSPFMATAVLRGLVETGVLQPAGEGWTIDRAGLAGAQTSRRAGLFLTRRLDLLSGPARQLLGAGAVLGKEFDLDTALELAELADGPAAAALEEGRRRRLVWVDERAGRCSFTHDKLRETLLEQMPAEGRRRLHERTARRLSHQDPAPVFELAYHYDAAGLTQEAFPYAIAAARLARSRYALDVAVTQYRIAERALESAGEDSRRAVYEGLGEVLSLAGDYAAAERYLQLAFDMAEGDMSRASLGGKLGDVAFRRGDQVAARRHVEGALRLLGRRVPRRNATFLLGAIWEILVQAGHTLFPRRLGRRSLSGADRDLLAARLYSRLAYVFWFASGRVPCAWSHLREMNLVERYPPTSELAQAWSEHAPVMTMIPWYKRGIDYARKSYDVRLALGDEWGQGQSMSFYGVVLYAASRFRDCIEASRQAVDLLSRMGDRWEENTASWHIAFSHYRLGEMAEAVEMARTVHARASAIGDQSSRGIALSAWARASEGNVPAELVAAELSLGTDDAHTSVEVRLAETVRLISEGDWAAACDMVEDAARIKKAAGLRQEYVAPVSAWAATARRGRAASLPAVAGVERRKALRQARRAARQALSEARWYRNNLPHARREAALVAAMGGRPRRAGRLIARSLAVAEEQGAASELELGRRAEEEIGRLHGDGPAPARPGRPQAAPASAGAPPADVDWTPATRSAPRPPPTRCTRPSGGPPSGCCGPSTATSWSCRPPPTGRKSTSPSRGHPSAGSAMASYAGRWTWPGRSWRGSLRPTTRASRWCCPTPAPPCAPPSSVTAGRWR